MIDTKFTENDLAGLECTPELTIKNRMGQMVTPSDICVISGATRGIHITHTTTNGTRIYIRGINRLHLTLTPASEILAKMRRKERRRVKK